jgi:phospholipase/carboxylesterase
MVFDGAHTLMRGEKPDRALCGMILMHGRGGTADWIMDFVEGFGSRRCAYLAPQAPGNSWYPGRFTAPLEENEPDLSSAFGVISRGIEKYVAAGIPAGRILLTGFSQGACISLEYAARHPRRYGGVLALSGGLMGPELCPEEYVGSLGNTPLLLTCSERDPFIPVERVKGTADIMGRLSADVTLRLYPDDGHRIRRGEIGFIARLLEEIERRKP